jgi:outer membrane biosynthesis protein TonB
VNSPKRKKKRGREKKKRKKKRKKKEEKKKKRVTVYQKVKTSSACRWKKSSISLLVAELLSSITKVVKLLKVKHAATAATAATTAADNGSWELTLLEPIEMIGRRRNVDHRNLSSWHR